ncbi:MAG: restriction endonuclease subunit S [Clostridia bacterium]|nr:restriction endonuclease subunit S [Clostridia bacterium]MDD4375795.1 restriction endonuclease subunit S [Clostridia bacterium]
MLELGLEILKNDFEKINDVEILSHIIKFVKGKKPINIDNNKQEGYDRYLTIACLKGQEFNYADITKMILSKNDLLMVMDGASSGEVYYGGQGIVGSTLARVDCIGKSYISEFIYFIMKYYKNLIQSKNTGSAIPHTDKGFIGSLEIPKLNIEEQKKYKNILNKTNANHKENVILTKLRDTLLPKLMNGEINLDKIEIEGMM